jgi:tetrapyrrole methylase family protein / MazG family protein
VAIQKEIADTASFDDLLALIAALRAENGCPWDRQQTPLTLTTYLIEETYELVEAIVADDTDAICEELGDVIFQILFVAHLFQEQGRFSLKEAMGRNQRKMVRRHPHVFGQDKAHSAEQVKTRWRQIKQQEKGGALHSLLDSVPTGTPALMRAYRLSERAAGVGFDWANLKAVMAQAEAEWYEFKQEIDALESSSKIADSKAAMEFGDVLFSLVNVARQAHIHPENALIQSIQKFVRRFQQMETMAAGKSRSLDEMPRDELEDLWDLSKKSVP